MSKIGKSRETENRLLLAGAGEGLRGRMCMKFLWEGENIVIVLMVTQL